MNKSTFHPLRNTVRIFVVTMLAVILTVGSGMTASAASNQAPVNLGKAASFVILSKSGITNVPSSKITGDMGVSPIAATAITGFALVADKTNTFSTSPQVTGKIYAASYASPTPANLTTAVSNMEAAYTDAAGRKNPNFTELYAGDISGKTLVPGLYKWGTGVVANKNVVLKGSSDSVFIFQVAGTLTVASNVNFTLSGGVQAKNIFWQVAGATTLGTNSHFEGNILCKTNIAIQTGASLNGRALAQTAVTLDHNVLVIPGSTKSNH
jgi:hypothetical protein